jgi:hypothetical protein
MQFLQEPLMAPNPAPLRSPAQVKAMLRPDNAWLDEPVTFTRGEWRALLAEYDEDFEDDQITRPIRTVAREAPEEEADEPEESEKGGGFLKWLLFMLLVWGVGLLFGLYTSGKLPPLTSLFGGQ